MKKSTHTNKQRISAFRKIWYVLAATHFLPSIGMTLLTTGLAYFSGQRSELYILVPAVLFGQFPVGWLNDYLDLNNDKIAKRKDKPLAMGYIQPATILRLALVSLCASVVLGFMYNRSAGFVNIAALTSALLYDFKLKGTVASIYTYIVSFSLLPMFVALGSHSHSHAPTLWLIAAFAALGAGVHFLNVLPDFADDAKTGVKGFVHYFSYSSALWIGASLMLLSASMVVLRLRYMTGFLDLVVGVFMLLAFIVFAYLCVKKEYPKAFKTANILTLFAITALLISAKYTLLV